MTFLKFTFITTIGKISIEPLNFVPNVMYGRKKQITFSFTCYLKNNFSFNRAVNMQRIKQIKINIIIIKTVPIYYYY